MKGRLRILVRVDQADELTHCAYDTALRTLCGLVITGCRPLRGRGQHGEPTCTTCATTARKAAAAVLEAKAAGFPTTHQRDLAGLRTSHKTR